MDRELEVLLKDVLKELEDLTKVLRGTSKSVAASQRSEQTRTQIIKAQIRVFKCRALKLR